MPFANEIDVEQRLIITRGVGAVTTADAFEARKQYMEDPRFDPSFRQLIDLTAATELAMSGDSIRQLATARVFDRETKRAIVVNETYHYGMARMFQTLRDLEGDQVGVFKDVREARVWLGVSA